jgi:DNA-binding GntR family transcriptional regulator
LSEKRAGEPQSGWRARPLPLSVAFEGRTVRTSAAGEATNPVRLVGYFRPRHRVTLAREHGVDIVRDAIVAGRLRPGTRLVERELCQALEVSRTVVREVIRDLEAERLIEATAHRGPSVATLTPKLVREIYDIRTELEVLLVKSYTVVASEEDLADLNGILGDLSVAGAQLDKSLLVETITRFLQHMVAVVDNQVVAEVFDQVLARINLLRMISMSVPGQIETSIIHISRLVDNIVARNAIAAEKTLRAYTELACSSALQALFPQKAEGAKTREDRVRAAIVRQ